MVMTTDTELHQACILDPDADAPRLAYADALLARGDPQGEFMALQLQAASAQKAGLPGALWRPLSSEANELKRAHAQAWTTAICPPCLNPVFVRGLVEHVTLSARDFLDNAPHLFERAPIRHLDLSDVGSLAAELFASPHLANIQSLRLDRCGLGDREVALLASSTHLTALRWLDLMRNDIGHEGARALAASPHLPSLRYVGFFGNPFDPSEDFSMDQGVVVDCLLSPDSVLLEDEFGHIPWLHTDARSDLDIPPRRY
jgi:uncharacterized protein (TIGR02996 family)